MTCRQLADFIADYLDDRLPADVRQAFEHHLALCPNCERYLEQYRTVAEAGREVFADPDGPVPANVPEGLIRAILASRRR